MSTLPRFALDLNSLQRQLGEATYIRAREVYVTQKVSDDFTVAQSGSQDWQLSATVQGSGRESYWVEINAEVTPWGEITAWKSKCSCPVGSRCKHAGALALKAAYRTAGVVTAQSSQPEPSHDKPDFVKLPALDGSAKKLQPAASLAERELKNWLDLFGDDAGGDDRPIGSPMDEEKSQGSGEDRLVFMVFEKSQNARPQLWLSLGLAREMVRGGWGKVKTPQMADTLNLKPDEMEVVRMVRAMSQSMYSYSNNMQAKIEGQAGQLALRSAQATGRLFWSDDGKSLGAPLELGAAREPQWQWNEKKQGNSAEIFWQLSARLAQESARVYANQPALYMDQDEASATVTLGSLASASIDAARLGTLMSSPPIAQSAWQHHEHALLKHLAGLPLPPFAKLPTAVQGITPIAHLFVEEVITEQRARFGMLMMTLHFDYAGVHYFSHRMGNPVLLDAKEHVKEGTQFAKAERLLLHRDLELETRVIGFLREKGLQGNTQGQFYLPPPLFPNQMPWVTWLDDAFGIFNDVGIQVTLPQEMLGWVQRVDALHIDLKGAPDTAVSSKPATTINEAEPVAPWFDLSLGIDVQGKRINILPALPALIEQLRLLGGGSLASDIELPESMFIPNSADGTGWLKLPTAPLKPWLSALLELLDGSHNLKGDSLRLSRMEALRLSAALGEGAVWQGAKGLQSLLAQLRGGANALAPVLQPEGLRAEMRPYQLQGLSWLQFLRQQGLAGVLADDMGLGKTLQTLAHILMEKEAGRLQHPALIIAPVSLMGNWRREAEKFTPSLRVLILHGSARHEAAQEIAQADIVLTPYSLLSRDKARWMAQRWSMVVLDEAQNIKNTATDAAQVAYELPANQRLCLSGTPMENHLGELWSLFHFLMPGFLGSAKRFKELYRTPIEKHGDGEILASLSRRVTPFILRRTKKQVLSDLPDKIETLSAVALEGKQADLYETIRLATEQSVREALSSKGLARSQIQVLDALLKLRQVCCDPRLVPLPAAKKVKQSAKLDLLMELLPEMLAEGRRILLFSQFTSMLELIEEELAARKLSWVKLTGQSRNRDDIIDQFTSGKVSLFLISLKAGGVGLNLPQADTVIHYDPWWNPAVENQATDRAHRIGQTSQVFVYKLIASGTIEERMLKLQERKAQLASSMLSGAALRKEALFSEDDVAQLLRPLGE
jgi:superfamily II DNA or RNA helicase